MSVTFDVDTRIDALIAALDEVVADAEGDFRRRKKKKKKAVEPVLKSVHVTLVMRALTEAAERAAGDESRIYLNKRVRPKNRPLQQNRVESYALSWYQLRDATRLNDDTLGLALSEVVPGKIRTRGTGESRIYFLPAEVRTKIRRKLERRRSNAA